MSKKRDIHGNKLHVNKPCGCGSNKKYKKCCLHADWPEWRDGPKPPPPEPKTPEQEAAKAREMRRRMMRLQSMASVLVPPGLDMMQPSPLPKPKPKPNPDKGKFGGACNREACQAYPASHYNKSTRKYYCGDCAMRINRDNGETICTPGEHRG